jgi:hypothetical protein
MKDDNYHINDEDIVSVLQLLRIVNPENATPEIAEAILQRMYERTHVLEHFNADAVETMLKDLEDH